MKNFLKIFVAVGIIVMFASCASFEEKTKSMKTSMMSFQDASLDAISLGDIKNMGAVEVSRTVTLVQEANGDYTITMGDFTYDWLATEATGEQTGTRTVGTLKIAEVGSAGGGSVSLGLLASMTGGMIGGADSSDAGAEAAPKGLTAREVAKDAVTYDLLEAVGRKGGIAVMLPQFTWDVETVATGTNPPSFLPFLGKTYEKKEYTYTVTARGTAVSF